MLKVESVFWNGSTASTSPMVTVPPPIEARRPPPFCSAMVTPWPLTRSSMASATRLPMAHSCARQVSRLPSMPAGISATTRDFSSSIGPASSSMRASVPGSGVTLASRSWVSPVGLGHHAGVVEGQRDVAEVLGVGAGLHDRHGVAVGAVDHERVLERRVLGGVGEERVAVAADDQVDAGHRRGDRLVAEDAEVAEQDDLVHALGLQRGHLAAQVVDRGAEADRRAGRGDLGGVRGDGAEDRHLLAADLQHQMVLGERREQVVGGDVGVAGDHRELGGLDELRQRLRAEVELVVAVDHGVEADAVQHLGLGLAGIGGEEERALEGVAGLEHEHVLARPPSSRRAGRRSRSPAAPRRRSTRPRPRPRPSRWSRRR